MDNILSVYERKQILYAIEGKSSYKRLKNPDQWHIFALNWNWDDGFQPLQWIIRQNNCDKGTALFIYWHADPVVYCQYSDRSEVVLGGKNVELYDFIKEIEVKYTSNFYTRNRIKFNPPNDDGYNWTSGYDRTMCRQEIPEAMTFSSPGNYIKREPLFDITIRYIDDSEKKKIERKIDQGFRIIRKYHPLITLDSKPVDIITEISHIIKQYSSKLNEVEQVSNNHPIMSLGWVWADQLCRAYNWFWGCYASENIKHFGVFSPDRNYISFPPRVILYAINVRPNHDKIYVLFNKLSDIQDPKDLSEAYSSGCIFLNNTLPSE